MRLPDPIAVARCERAPELGPRILFFSGGTALKRTSRRLKRYTHNSIHLITPFDSGGSSAGLRRAFGMLAVGDLRNRLMTLADEGARGTPPIYDLFSHRFPTEARQSELEARLEAMVRGVHPLVAAVPSPMRRLIRTYLGLFARDMPASFDLRGASIGNLILAGGWLNNDGDMDSVVFLFSRLVEVRGTVLPIVDQSAHLAVDLADGSEVVGQHNFTGKERPVLTQRIDRLRLVRGLDDPRDAELSVHDKVTDLIASADLIVYPMGSFWSSVMCNLLPRGVGRAIAAAECPKIHFVNTGADPEQVGRTASQTVGLLIDAVRADAGPDVPVERILNAVLIDTVQGDYRLKLDLDAVRALGVDTCDLALANDTGRLDRQRLSEVLVSLA